MTSNWKSTMGYVQLSMGGGTSTVWVGRPIGNRPVRQHPNANRPLTKQLQRTCKAFFEVSNDISDAKRAVICSGGSQRGVASNRYENMRRKWRCEGFKNRRLATRQLPAYERESPVDKITMRSDLFKRRYP